MLRILVSAMAVMSVLGKIPVPIPDSFILDSYQQYHVMNGPLIDDLGM